MKSGLASLALASLVFSLYGCGSGSGSSTGRGGLMDGELTLKITDAAVDSALAVWVKVNGVTLKPEDGEQLYFDYSNPDPINLLALQLGKTEVLLQDVKVPAGKYNWIRLHVETEGVLDSYIVLSDGPHELAIPSGEQSGLQIIKNLEVQSNGDVNLVIDFDLRQSIVLEGNGSYSLKPVLRLVDLDEVGSISGTIDPALLVNGCSDADPLTGNAVYVFSGEDAAVDDIDGDKKTDPIATSTVVFNDETGDYEYSVSYIEEGEYTIAFTCQADLDLPDSDDNIVFSMTENVEVELEVENMSR